MSAEADNLDREAQHLDNQARDLDAVAGDVERGGADLTSIVSTLRTPFLQSVGNTWIGPQAEKFMNGAQTRYERLSRNEATMREVATAMRRKANENRNEANRKRDRARQLRREEEGRNRQRR